ncbi:DUF4184 family protein [Mangrovivirga cuniculi]|uniref:DUF4184 domain-containing protein n=1 Tax=Mangrovivirga cuniculi TaxID=2715131 RepID=A0A4D7K6R0_9BACT|nr:DUF4184 family protein [Mangrovivirga cuniculi]QCK16434.1 hypothetical protein DCC35_17705 [Mangrovivirga cuniculi]
MPFTLSHTVAVLPLREIKILSLTGLIIGSMTPDFEYFLRMSLKSEFSHEFLGVFYFDLPVGIAICFIYHQLCKEFIIDNSPPYIFKRMVKFREFKWMPYFKQNALWIILSVLIGTLTHVFWDSFTHGNGLMVKVLPFLKTRIPVLDTSYPIFYMFQHISTAIGLILFFYWFSKLEKSGEKNKGSSLMTVLFLVIAVMIFVIRMIIMSENKEVKIGHVIVITISAIVYSTIISSVIHKYRLRKNPSKR